MDDVEWVLERLLIGGGGVVVVVVVVVGVVENGFSVWRLRLRS